MDFVPLLMEIADDYQFNLKANNSSLKRRETFAKWRNLYRRNFSPVSYDQVGRASTPTTLISKPTHMTMKAMMDYMFH